MSSNAVKRPVALSKDNGMLPDVPAYIAAYVKAGMI